MIKTQVCIIGAGAGGIGCAYRLIKNGIKTVVVDKNSDFGGTMVFSGVDGWEPGVTLDGLHQLLYDEMSKIENGCHIVRQVPGEHLFTLEGAEGWNGEYDLKKLPWAVALRSEYKYSDTYKRTPYRFSKRLQFEPSAMIKAVDNIFKPYKENLNTFFGFRYLSCETQNEKITGVTITDGINKEKICADIFVDATGDIVFARDAGCKYAIGTEGKEDYNEPSARTKTELVNGATFVFRIRKVPDNNHIDQIPPEYDAIDIEDYKKTCVKNKVSYIVEYPNGDFNVNMLPTMQGNEYLSLGDKAEKVGRAMVWAYWNYLQKEKNMKGFSLIHIYDAGVRESYRLVGKYVLKEQDLRAGILRQPKIGRTIAIADHAMDVHGEGGMCKELTMPYEIPIECAMANEFDNLFVSSKAASFTHIAASSVRLSRTMISMGEGVGEYIAEKIKSL